MICYLPLLKRVLHKNIQLPCYLVNIRRDKSQFYHWIISAIIAVNYEEIANNYQKALNDSEEILT